MDSTNQNRKKKIEGRKLPDGVTSPETNPLRNRTVLLLGFGKLLLGTEGLLALLIHEQDTQISTVIRILTTTKGNINSRVVVGVFVSSRVFHVPAS